MIVALLAALSGICLTGWLFTTGKFRSVAWVENLHEGLPTLLMVLVLLHVSCAMHASWRHCENLVAAMIDVGGRTRVAGAAEFA
jgi:cytochrome b